MKKLYKVTFTGEAIVAAVSQDLAIQNALFYADGDLEAAGIEVFGAEAVEKESDIPTEWRGCIPLGLNFNDEEKTCEEFLAGGEK